MDKKLNNPKEWLQHVVTSVEETTDDYIATIREALEERFSKRREGLHVSDITLCPRQVVFKEIDRVPLTDKELNMISSGKAIHEAVQSLFMSNSQRFEKEKHVEHEKAQGSIDVYDKEKNIPIEFKTSRSAHIDKPKSFHVEQLKYYMAMLNPPSYIGYIIYQCLMHFNNNPFPRFRITMTEQEREHQLTKLVKETESLDAAKKTKDPSIARHVYYDRELNWLCKGCPYAQKCEQMISTDRQISKMTEILVPVTKRQHSSSCIGSSNGKETIQ